MWNNRVTQVIILQLPGKELRGNLDSILDFPEISNQSEL